MTVLGAIPHLLECSLHNLFWDAVVIEVDEAHIGEPSDNVLCGLLLLCDRSRVAILAEVIERDAEGILGILC